MADRYTAQVSAVQLSTTSTETTLQLLADADSRVKIWGWTYSFGGPNGVTATDPGVLCEVVRQTSVGTGSSTLTPRPLDDQAPAADTEARSGFTGEPSDTGVIVASAYVHPQVGAWTEQLAEPIICDVSTRIGWRTTTTGAADPSVTLTIHFEE